MGWYGGQLISGPCEDAPCCGCGPEGCVQPGAGDDGRGACYCDPETGEQCDPCESRESALDDDLDEEPDDRDQNLDDAENDGGFFGPESFSEE